ncbi:hypothetical protein HanHA300_Chr02g0060071 [Helianthus annuus]|nr:hypothetical protein HanHA300_Chr02g0060071 [Helianthus annuus]KAJ0619220.1 hypothetical protein HanHA89_Chr02g0068891 [Helianthus annuus]KAJ0777671.1 hypothetical protein HanLR1_Chr02g0063131 [Helianthus annuus]KAJ0786696.1 hypothetical protein HanOQP8_Chr02g0074201 [Helianthus annuus]
MLEYSMKGRQFTRVLDNGRKLSKIDRFLVCVGFFNRWPEACLRVLSKNLSDHFSFSLITKDTNFGPRPFRVFNSSIDKPGYIDTVRAAANSFSCEGPADFFLANKLVHIRNKIKQRRDDMIKREGSEEAAARIDIEELEILLESRDLSEEELWFYQESKKVMAEIEDNKNRDLKQI